MEDRPAAALYLETSPLPPDECAGRTAELAGHPGVERATRWENACPGRRDLPRRLDEFTTLLVAEAGAGFRPPPPPDAGIGLFFLPYPRPAQGRLTGRPTKGILLVLISPRSPEVAQELRDWADFVHIRHIAEAAVPGYTMITPYENASGGEPRFLHFYEMDTDDPEATFRSMTPLVQERLGPPGTPAFDQWALHPSLRIDYVNTFRLAGEQS